MPKTEFVILYPPGDIRTRVGNYVALAYNIYWGLILVNKAKKISELDGRKFLQESFEVEQDVLKVQLALSAKSITHDSTMGSVTESHFLSVLRRYLPKRYTVDIGIVIDSTGKTSDQIDIIIYDNQYTPVLLDQEAHRYIPAEAVYAIFESKPTINKAYLEYASDKAASVRVLARTSIPIDYAAGTYPAKPVFPIIAGIIASTIDWADGFGTSFINIHKKLKMNGEIDCGLAVSGHCFDTFGEDGTVQICPNNHALIYFLFRLLQKLQSLGTVPAIDWNVYANILSE